jgi:hypothetical protein
LDATLSGKKGRTRRFINLGIAAFLVPVFLVLPIVPANALNVRAGHASSKELLNTLELREEARVPYDAGSFEYWTDADGDGCDSASEALIAASHPSFLVVEAPCKVVSGSWFSPYETWSYTNPADMTIDHVIPLEEAWQSGAWAWTNEERRDFANDLRYMSTANGGASELFPVGASAVKDKGSKDPAEWRPPYQGWYCGYASTWVFLKSRWNLSVDPAEYDALKQMLSMACPEPRDVIPERGLSPARGPGSIIGTVWALNTAPRLLAVEAYAEDGSVAGRATLDSDLDYALTGLAPGTYTVKAIGGSSGALDEWYHEDGLGNEPTPVQVAAGGITSGIDMVPKKPQQYTDIPQDHYYFDIIAEVSASGFLSGYPDGTFRPEVLVDRGSLSTILYRYAGSPSVPSDAPMFQDVPAGSEEYDAIRWVAAVGIDTGFADGDFRPRQEITRRTLAVFLHRMSGRPPVPADAPTYSAYTDIQPGIPDFEELAWLASTFVIWGDPDGNFRPDTNIDRGSIAASIRAYRYLKPSAPGSQVGVIPFRALDTRKTAPVGADSTVSFQVGGVNGIPADVSAVVFNLTATEASSFGFVSAYASGSPRPNASNLNYGAGQTVAILVTVPVGPDGKVTLFNRSSGTAQLIADVSGYYIAGTPTAAGTLQPAAPSRFLDTRKTAPVGADSAVSFQVAGVNGIPTDVSAVVFNMTVTEASSFGFVSAYASGSPQPNASNLNYAAGQTVANLVTVPVGPDGKVALFNRSAGTAQLIADVSGYYKAGSPIAAGTLQPIAPSRFLDTRKTGPVAADSAVSFQVGGVAGIPSNVSAVVFNMTLTEAKSFGFVSAYASGSPRPNASNLNYGGGQTIPNLVTVPVGADGKVTLFNRSAGTAQLIADVSGYYTASAR